MSVNINNYFQGVHKVNYVSREMREKRTCSLAKSTQIEEAHK